MFALWILLANALLAAQPAGKDVPLAPIAVDYAMDSDPLLEDVRTDKVFSDQFFPLWLQALDRPEADIQRLVAASVAVTHHGGYANMEKAKPGLLRILAAKETRHTPRLAAAHALLVLDAKERAPELWQAAQTHGEELRQLIEPALAGWEYQPAYDVWRNRLTGTAATHRERMLAIRCLGQVRDLASAPQFLALMRDVSRLDAERLAAAQAAGRTKESGLEVDAGQMARAGGKVIDRLCAVSLLERHESNTARTILLTLAIDPEPSVAAAALRRLNSLDFALVLPLAEPAIHNPDSGVRREGARCFAARPALERVKTLGKLLDDPHSGIRAMVREDFRRLAGDSQWNNVVRQSALEALAAEGWRGQEQAALLLATLDDETAAPLLVKRLDSPRAEVMIASAWALRKLAVRETLPALFQKATQLTDLRIRLKSNYVPLDHEAAHLFEALALMKYEPAYPLMNRYIAKDYIMGEYSRSAAIWGLGHVHVGKSNETLAAAIIARVTEPTIAMPPEMTRVRLAGTIALGKMKAKSQAGPLRASFAQPVPSRLYLVTRWSLREITGDELPLPPPLTESLGGWFLEPLEGSDQVAPK
jgi:HEAT repeat protein